ncbi:MAG: tetratricopeptide repeat protein, partial [Bacilli bacterium]|nr:tetratricopeptide repeat protein [Bacilli bacterium]
IELLFSFGVIPGRAIELGTQLFNYFAAKNGEVCYECGYYAFQTGWTYLFNLHLVHSVSNAKMWFDRSYRILSQVEINEVDQHAAYGHLLSHLSRVNLVMYEENKDPKLLEEAKMWAEKTIENAEKYLGRDTPFYSRLAVAYMQMGDVYIAAEEYEKALTYVEDAYGIMFSLFGEEDPDSLNVSSRKSTILYHLGRYSEAYALGVKNLEGYDKFCGKLNYLRFEQLVTTFKCCVKVGTPEQIQAMRENVLSIGEQLLSETSKQLQELKQL